MHLKITLKLHVDWSIFMKVKAYKVKDMKTDRQTNISISDSNGTETGPSAERDFYTKEKIHIIWKSDHTFKSEAALHNHLKNMALVSVASECSST